MTTTADGLIPAAVTRHHWMNQVDLHAQMKPDATAFKHLGEATSWAQLAELMDRTAAALRERGVTAGDRVLVLTLNHLEAVLAVLGPNRLGAIAVPINARLTPAEVAYIVDDADADIIIVDAALAPVVQKLAEHTNRLRRVVVVGEVPAEIAHSAGTDGAQWESFSALTAHPTDGFEPPDVPETDVCLIMYTSGTTGRPKGAMLTHINMQVQANTSANANSNAEEAVSLLTAPLFHIAAWGSLAATISHGNTVVLHPLGGFDPVELLDSYEAEGATTVFNVPQQWQAICAAVERGKPGGGSWDLKLRTLTWGAAPASAAVLREMARCFPEAEIVAAFGQTEMSPVTCLLRGEDSLRKIGSIGKPVPAIAARVVDPAMNDVAPGEVGEIVYRGPTLMRGYWRRPEATAEAFAGGWFHSGDLVRVDDEGFFYIVDRAKDMVISGGENIYCTEVENVLFDHPAILEAAVYGRPDERWGEVPVAAVALREGAELTLEELRDWLGDKLARFKQPHDLVFVDALPRNASGKVRKVELREGG